MCVKQQDMSDLGDTIPSVRLGICDNTAIASCSSRNHFSSPLRFTVAVPSLRGLGSVCPSLPGEEVGDSHGVRPAFGRSVVLSWGHVTAQGRQTTAVRSGGKRAGELLLLPCGEAGGDLQLEAQGGAVRGLEAGQATHLQEGAKAHGPRQRKRAQGGNGGAKHRAPQSSGSQGSPFPCEVWGNAMH